MAVDMTLEPAIICNNPYNIDKIDKVVERVNPGTSIKYARIGHGEIMIGAILFRRLGQVPRQRVVLSRG